MVVENVMEISLVLGSSGRKDMKEPEDTFVKIEPTGLRNTFSKAKGGFFTVGAVEVIGALALIVRFLRKTLAPVLK